MISEVASVSLHTVRDTCEIIMNQTECGITNNASGVDDSKRNGKDEENGTLQMHTGSLSARYYKLGTKAAAVYAHDII